jgi:hypothetical protein
MVSIRIVPIRFLHTPVIQAGQSKQFGLHPLYIAGYLVGAAGLFWHYRFFMFDEKKVIRIWKEQSR